MKDQWSRWGQYWLNLTLYNTLKRYKIQGVPFRTYLYVPEEHPETKSVFYEREDEAHLIKVGIAMYFVVIISYTVWSSVLQVTQEVEGQQRSSLSSTLKLSVIPLLVLMYPALVGARKQSMIDAERLFSTKLVDFMKKERL